MSPTEDNKESPKSACMCWRCGDLSFSFPLQASIYPFVKKKGQSIQQLFQIGHSLISHPTRENLPVRLPRGSSRPASQASAPSPRLATALPSHAATTSAPAARKDPADAGIAFLGGLSSACKPAPRAAGREDRNRQSGLVGPQIKACAAPEKVRSEDA